MAAAAAVERERREPWNSGAGEKKKKGDRHSSEIRTSRVEGNKTRGTRSAERSVDPSFSPHPIDLHLVLAQEGRKERKGREAGGKRSELPRAGDEQASANGRGERGGRGGVAARYQPFVCAADAKLC